MTTTEHPFGFSKVFVIESLPPGGTHTGKALFDKVVTPLVLSLGLRAQYRTIVGARDLVASLADIRKECIEQDEGPIIHVEAHGFEDHLELGGGDKVSWESLRDQLTEINDACRMNLLVVMATCSGAHLARILRPMYPAPAWGVVGPTAPIYDGDLLDGMKAFYEQVLSGVQLFDAVANMNIKRNSYTPPFEFLSAELLFWKAFRGYTAGGDPETIKERADRMVVRMVLEKGATVDQTPVLRQQFIEQLGDQRGLFSTYRKQFLMLDRFPANEARFPLTFDDFTARG